MSERISGNRCTIRTGEHDLCGRTGLEGAPFPICVQHLTDIKQWAGSMWVPLLTATGRPAVKERPNRRAPLKLDRFADGYRPVVYYVKVGAVIKVGYSDRVHQRIKNYPPHAVLLATEPGDLELEKQRHGEFRRDLAAGREWFHPSAALIAHINSLREQPLTAAELAA